MEGIRCNDCGRFIGIKDIQNNNTVLKRIYDQQGIPIEDVIIHIKCQLKTKSLNKTTGIVQNEQKGG